MANQINVTSGTGNIQVTTSRSVIAVTTVANANVANTANYAGNVTGNAQPNITSVGTLTGLTSSGNITAPYFIGNVVGNISGNIVVPGNNTSVLFNQVGNAGASDALQFDYSANVLKVTGNANVTGKLTLGGNIEGNLLPQANGTQDIGSNTQRWNDLYLNGNTIYLGSQTLESNATHTTISGVITGNGAGLTNVSAASANSVAVGNVSGIGNIATVNLDGNASNVLFGNGTFGPEGSSGNANYANFAGTAFSVSGSNVSGAVANATYANSANTANSATIAASANSVAVANVSGIGNIATVNLDGNAGNILYGNGVFATLPNVANVANANYANFAGTAFNVSGSNVSGTVANATYADNAGNANIANLATYATTANAVAGANVSGTVANATYAANAGHATTANTVTDNAQPNITSVGTLSNLAVSGNITANVITANYINANVNFGNVDSIQFDTAANVTLSNVGQVAWDDGDGTLQLLMKGGNVTQQIGTQEYARVYNAEATTLNKGEVVYIFGAQGNRVSVKRAQANTEATSVGTLGFVAETIAAGAEGYIIVSGALYKLNTNGLTAGNAVYLSPSIAGGYTQTKPVAPNQLVVLGWIERVSATVGSIYVKVDNGYELDELHNVLIANAVAGQALVYNASNLWVNGNPNVANSALSVAGANVVGEVANANFASFSNVANSANAVAGANVSGTVANANYASYANVANSANSVAVANVSGIGNIATLNLDGNASNILYGNGIFAAPAVISNVANANYANFAGDVVNATQSNITSIGNLVNATINANIANSTTVQIDGTLITTTNGDFYQVIDAYDDGNGAIGQTSTGKTLHNYQGFGTWEDRFYANDGTGNAYAGFQSFDYNDVIGNSSTDPLVPSQYTITTYNSASDLTNSSTGTGTQVTIGAPGFNVIVGTQTNQPAINIFEYTDVGLRFNVRSGNSDARANVVANTSLGNIEWRPAGRASNGAVSFNTKNATIGAKVDSAYTGANAETVPTGLELTVVNSSNTQVTHSYYANGNISFAGAISATNLGNVSALNLDGNAGNILYGNGIFAAVPSVTLTGDGGNISNINGANVTGTVASANIANLVNVSNANAGTSGTFYPVFVAATGNGAVQLDNVGNTITYNPSTSVLTFNTAKVDKVGNDNNGENIDFDGTNNSIRTSVTGLANAVVISNSSVNVNSNLNVTGTIAGTANLTSLTVNPNITGGTIVSVGNLTDPLSGAVFETINAYDDGTTFFNTGVSRTINNYAGFGAWEQRYYANDGTNVAYGGFQSFDFNDVIGNSGSDPLVPTSFQISVFSSASDLANSSTQTGTNFNLGTPGIQLTVGTNTGTPVFQVNNYGDTGLRFNTRNGNSDARANVAASSYLGNIEWRPAGRASNGAVSYNTETSYITAKVDAGYTGANAETVPQGLEFAVVDSSNNRITHDFYANGEVTFADNVTVGKYLVLANDTAANIANLTGVAGAMISVSDQDDQPAYWSATANVWKYVSNRANV